MVLSVASCSSKGNSPSVSTESTDESSYYRFLGDYSYESPAVMMVYEPVDGETDEQGGPLYGIQYREIKDLDGLLAGSDKILIYFYSSMAGDRAGITAGVEDVAQAINGKAMVIALDSMEYPKLVGKYDITAVPEFVLIRKKKKPLVFGASARGEWRVSDVVTWLSENDITIEGDA